MNREFGANARATNTNKTKNHLFSYFSIEFQCFRIIYLATTFFFHWICVEWMWRTCMAKNNKKCSFCDVHKSCRLYESCSAICMYRTGTILNGNARDKQRIKTDRTSIFFRQSAKVLKPKSREWATKMAMGQ